MKKNIVIIHYNTPLLTECLVRSINLFVKDAVIYIFDNSDERPFTAYFDNVLVLDNTKGEIINFDKWLEKYPHRHRSHGRVNSWGSAKHCYSVQKCMELIKENFILLDSDVLLKKDISDLYDKDIIYSGEVVVQPNSSIKRVLPFITYINTEMCLKNGVKYFDENYMHGLYYMKNNKDSDKYDTGGGFYINASKFKHKELKCSDYVVHYGHGSWNKAGEKPKLTAGDWLEVNKKYWSNEKNKKVIYTCITGGYDSLIEPKIITKGFDYVCFTDNKDMKSDVWEIIPLPKETEGLSQVKKQRYVKINSHLVLGEYDLSIWVDGNVTIKDNLNKFLDDILKEDCSIYVPQHPNRKCIYAESEAVIAMKKDTREIIKPQLDRYKSEGFPKDFGLLQSNIMIRKHNEKDCIKFMEEWFSEVKNGSHRDQLSFNYVQWKNQDIKVEYLDKKIYKSEWFNWTGGHGKKVISSRTSITTTRKISSTRKPRKSIEELKKEFRAMMEERKSRHSRKVTTDKLSIYTV
jgi:hypothetical protein